MGIRHSRDWSSSGGEMEVFSQLQTTFDSGRFFAEVNASREGYEALMNLEFNW
jgi:hypothetical protein